MVNCIVYLHQWKYWRIQIKHLIIYKCKKISAALNYAHYAGLLSATIDHLLVVTYF